MDSWLKAAVMAIGVILGLVQPREAPPASMRLHRDADALYLSLELEGTPGGELMKVVDSFFTLRLTLKAGAGSLRAEAWREIRFVGKEYEIRVSETGGVHRTADAGAAWNILTRFGSLRVGRLGDMAYPFECTASLALSFPEDKDYDPMVLWAYRPATASRTIEGPGSLPYR